MLPVVTGVALAVLSPFRAAAQGGYGECSGRGANPEVYNFEINGNPAKVVRDVSLTVPVEAGFPFNDDPAVIKRALRRRFLNDSFITLDFNPMYVDLGGEGLLLDTGNGMGGNEGRMLSHLEADGISRESIKNILISHMHPDHIGGLVTELGSMELTYLEATIHIHRLEYEYWNTDPVDVGAALRTPEEHQATIDLARGVSQAIDSKVKLFEAGDEPIPGFKAISTPWHTPGHVSFAIDDGDSKLLYAGDSLLNRVLSIENPWISSQRIDFSPTSVSERFELLDMAVKERWKVAAYHADFPGLMFVDNEGVNFATTRAVYESSPDAMSVCT